MPSPFYPIIGAAILIPAIFMRSIWNDAKGLGWNWISDTSRAMYVDVAKTLITASGIAVALLASSSSSARAADSAAKISAQAGVISLIACICFSLVTMLALTRGYEQAKSRHWESGGTGEQGQLTNNELLWIVLPGYFALASFIVGLLFLGRVTFHT